MLTGDLIQPANRPLARTLPCIWCITLPTSSFLDAQGTGPAFRAALWASEEAGLRADRCEMLQHLS